MKRYFTFILLSLLFCGCGKPIFVDFTPRVEARLKELKAKVLTMPEGDMQRSAQLAIRNATWQTRGSNPVQGILEYEFRVMMSETHEEGADTSKFQFKPAHKKWKKGKEIYGYAGGMWSLIKRTGPPGGW